MSTQVIDYIFSSTSEWDSPIKYTNNISHLMSKPQNCWWS